MNKLDFVKYLKASFSIGEKLYHGYENFKEENPELAEKLEDAIKKEAKKQAKDRF